MPQKSREPQGGSLWIVFRDCLRGSDREFPGHDVLAGQPEGHLLLSDLRNNVAILISSDPDWTDRTKRIAARTPGLDIFSQGMVLRSSAGWRITDAGRAFLADCEVPISSNTQEASEAVEIKAPVATLPAAPAIGPDTRRWIWRRRRRERKVART
jgi:hypothetical protein